MSKKEFNEELDKECKEFMNTWADEKHINFIQDIEKIFNFYNIIQKTNMFKDILTEDENIMMQAVCTIFLVSKFAETHAENLNKLNIKFNGLWKKIELAGTKLPNI